MGCRCPSYLDTCDAFTIFQEVEPEITVKDVTPRFSLRSTAEARELISNYGCHEGRDL